MKEKTATSSPWTKQEHALKFTIMLSDEDIDYLKTHRIWG
jgi:hypothetical protein